MTVMALTQQCPFQPQSLDHTMNLNHFPNQQWSLKIKKCSTVWTSLT